MSPKELEKILIAKSSINKEISLSDDELLKTKSLITAFLKNLLNKEEMLIINNLIYKYQIIEEIFIEIFQSELFKYLKEESPKETIPIFDHVIKLVRIRRQLLKN